MRCLYCGKELALLKRLTSGGEFCSDAHRQQYQNEYNQLALNRLLQAKPPGESKPEAKPAKATETKKSEEPARVATPAPAPVEVPVMAAAKAAPAPIAKAIEAPLPIEQEEDGEPVPAEASGFFIELPVPAMAEVAAMSTPELEMEHTNSPAVPEHAFEAWGTELVAAGIVLMHPAISILDSSRPAPDRRLDVREFVRGVPAVEIDLPLSRETGLPEELHEPMEIPTVRYPPQEAVALWEEPAQDFTSYETELGEMARVSFATTGIEQSEKPVSAPEAAAKTAPVQVLAPVIEKKSDPVPELITRPMPVTLLGVAAGRGKPLPVFTSGVATGVDVQIPRSSSLPLRPVMTLEAVAAPEEIKVEEKQVEPKKPEEKKPSERTVIVKDSRKPQPGRQDPRFANGKVRKAEARVSEPEKVELEKVEPEKKDPPVEIKAPEIAASVEAPVEKKPEPEIKTPELKTPEEKPARHELPEPINRPYTTPDLGLPSLSMQPSTGFLGNLPIAGKLALAAVIVLIIGGAIYMSMKGSSADASTSVPRVVEAPALAAGDAGWVTDWGAEPGVRRQHDISILRPSMSLADYRMEFQAQIENKALGWVYRAQDGKNYYVSKLEIVKSGAKPTVALVRFAVVNGEEQPRAQFPLSMPVRLDTMYSIRFDAVGDHFTTFVQDQKIDDFTDARIKTGGVGLYNEHGEKLGLKGSVRVVPLVIKK